MRSPAGYRFRPDLVLVGHVHQAPFVPGGTWVDPIGTTWAVNPGQQPGVAPAHVLIDLDADTATWTSAAGQAQIHLEPPR